jgi:hypothetical protein
VVLDSYEEPWGPVGVPQQKGTLGLLLVCFFKNNSGSGFGNQTRFWITWS